MQTIVKAGWQRLLATGVATLVLGIVAIVWPGPTLLAVGVLFGIYLVVSGVLELVVAFESHLDTAMRVLAFVSGALSVVVGLFCFRDDLTSLVLLGIWIGIAWLFRGISQIGMAIAERNLPARGWQGFFGVVSAVAGIMLLVWPISSVATLVLVAGIWLIPLGIIEIVSALAVRRRAKELPAGA